MDKFIGKITEVINNNSELKNSAILGRVIENIQYKSSGVDNLTLLTLIKEGLSDVNIYLKNEDITSIISSVNTKITECEKSDINGFIKKSYNEFDIVSLAESLKNSEETKSNPRLCGYLNELIRECQSNKYPTYLYLNPMINSLNGFNEYTAVKESVDSVTKYLNENMEKLIVLDTINYLDSIGSTGFHTTTTNALKQFVFESQYNPDIISLKLGDASKNGSVSAMLESLRSLRNQKTPQFDLGDGKNGTEIYNYVGPVLKEDKDITFYIGESFIHISPNSLDESMVKRTISNGDVKLYEMNELSLFNTNREFYNTVKAYEALGFKLAKNGVTTMLNKTKVDFKVNESNTLDLLINSNVVTNITTAKANNSFILESKEAKTCLFNILENLDSMYNMPFVKFILNEQKGLASMVINLQDDYFVYDYIGEKIDIYKLDAYKLYEFVLNKFNYDISSLYKFQIDDARTKVSKLNEQQQSILNAISKLEESVIKIDEATKADIKADDTILLSELKSNILGEIDKLKSKYINVCESIDIVLIPGKSLITENEDTSTEEGAQPTDTAQSTDAPETTETEDTSESIKKKIINENIQVSEPQGVQEKSTPEGDTTQHESNSGNIVDFTIPDWAVSALINGDDSGLTEEDIDKIQNFVEYVSHEYGNANFMLDSGQDEKNDPSNLGFLHYNDIDNLGSNCVKLTLRPTINESWLGDVFGKISGYFGKIFKSAKIDAVLKKYQNELPVIEKNKIELELEIELAKKTNSDISTVTKQLDMANKQEAAIRAELEAGIKEILATRPDLKPMADKMRAQTEKTLLETIKADLEAYKTDGKYADVAPAITAKLTTIQQKEVELDNIIKSIADIKPTSNQNPNIYADGDTIKSTNQDGTFAYYMVTNVERNGEKVTGVWGKMVNDGTKLADLKTIAPSTASKINPATITKVIDPTELMKVYGNNNTMEQFRINIIPKTEPAVSIPDQTSAPVSTPTPTNTVKPTPVPVG